ncbi:SNF1-related protein kinase regulatory subunit beta-2-like [Gastrolobium bilobum]|uniref:SNF1-related protein kinase regulatory subunit beta-2-like n=1 Tax=Gastrolobium bilobum TaxID=150636 RepID=UPI002AB0CC2B|nr:SNF1-related protein kinase regulatory subunit beta-2-like [Gastrolobium bilobum]XP_061344154.1 SNF1-related protein kinase regulatory subunit beta-2-like [Gastrolobium bilobum]
MGSNSRGKDGEGTSGVNKVEENYENEQDMKFLPAELFPRNSNGPRAYEPPPPLQVPVVDMQRRGAVAQPQPDALLQNGYVECVLHERLKRVKIIWNHAGTNVAIAGSWDNWETTEPLKNVGQNFCIVKALPIAIYHYRFLVDGYWTYAPEFPSATDDSGYGYNILDLQDYIPETLERLSDFEDPSSPPSSYDNIFNEDEFSKPPPELPPQLPVTIKHEPSSTSNSRLVPRPTHLELNHLYIHKTDRDQFVALRSTHKFQHKYVTMVLYKTLRR